MALETRPFDPANYIGDDTDGAEYISYALETGDMAFIADAFATVMRARGMSGLASETGLSRAALYRSFGKDGNPTLDTLMRVMGALGLKLKAERA